MASEKKTNFAQHCRRLKSNIGKGFCIFIILSWSIDITQTNFRLIVEMKFEPKDAYLHIKQVLEQVNFI